MQPTSLQPPPPPHATKIALSQNNNQTLYSPLAISATMTLPSKFPIYSDAQHMYRRRRREAEPSLIDRIHLRDDSIAIVPRTAQLPARQHQAARINFRLKENDEGKLVNDSDANWSKAFNEKRAKLPPHDNTFSDGADRFLGRFTGSRAVTSSRVLNGVFEAQRDRDGGKKDAPAKEHQAENTEFVHGKYGGERVALSESDKWFSDSQRSLLAMADQNSTIQRHLQGMCIALGRGTPKRY
jgi:hypothetical protein